MYIEKRPPWVRALQIGLGAIIIALSIWALLSPADAFVLIVRLLAIILFFVGIERVISGIFLPGKQRFYSIGLGILILILAGIAISTYRGRYTHNYIHCDCPTNYWGFRIIEGPLEDMRILSRISSWCRNTGLAIGIAILVFRHLVRPWRDFNCYGL